MVREKEGDDLGRHLDEQTVTGSAESLLAFENAPLGLAVILPLGRIAMANRAARRLLGYELNELVGKFVYDVVVREHEQRSWAERVESGETATAEHRLRLRCKDGGEVPARGSSLLVLDSHGCVRYVIARAVPDPPR